MDLDFGFDIDFDDADPIDSVTTKNRFTLEGAVAKLSGLKKIIPDEGESIRVVSDSHGFSSCALIMKIAELTEINELYASTLRVGKKELDAIVSLNIENVSFAVGKVMKQADTGYAYNDYFEITCEENGFAYQYVHNHSKVILLNTAAGRITIETSSNLNENPQIEQFCITNDTSVYDYYLRMFRSMGLWKNEQTTSD